MIHWFWSNQDSYKVLYLIKGLLIKHINIQATKSADIESDQPSTSTAEMKSTMAAEEIKSPKSADDEFADSKADQPSKEIKVISEVHSYYAGIVMFIKS